MHHLAGRYEEALACFREALNIRHGLGYRMGSVVNLHNIGDAHFRMGDPSRAWAAFNQSRDQAEQMDWEPGVIMNDAFISYLEASEDPEAAQLHLNQVVSRSDSMLLHDTRISSRWLLGKLHADRGESAKAKSIWTEAVSLAESLDAPRMASDIKAELDAMG